MVIIINNINSVTGTLDAVTATRIYNINLLMNYYILIKNKNFYIP